MFASATIGHSNREIRATRIVRSSDGEPRTIRVRPARSNEKRNAILASGGFGR